MTTQLTQREQTERKIVRHLCDTMAAHGWKAVKVNDGGDIIRTSTTDEVMEAVFSVDEASIFFKKEGESPGCIALIILGNGCDCISDHSYPGEDHEFVRIMEAEVDPFCEALQ